MARQFLLAIGVCFLGAFVQVQSAWAEAERVVIELPLYGQLIYGGLTLQAESMVLDSISRYFAQTGGQSEIEVVVLGDRYGEIVPILTTTVSRTQWQKNPQVSAWTHYYSGSQALLQRHQDAEAIATASAPRQTAMSRSLVSAAQIDAAFDAGNLTGAVAQTYLSYLD